MTFPVAGAQSPGAHYAGTVSDPAEPARRCAETMYADDKVAQDLGMEITAVAPGRAVLRMTLAPAMVNDHGIAHGGYLFLLADSAFAYACNTHGAVTVRRVPDGDVIAEFRGGSRSRKERVLDDAAEPSS
jgi:acyl-CoA thioesterase